MNVYYSLCLTIPMVGFLGMLLLAFINFKWSIRGFLFFTALGFGVSIAALIMDLDVNLKISYLLSSLILFVSMNIQKFSYTYMQGDNQYKSYFIKLALISVSSNLMVLVANDWLFWFFWSLNGLLLATLMIHKWSWSAARYSGLYTFATLSLGSLFLAIAFLLPENQFAKWALVLAAMCQSAIMPFHRWLLSSLNSPTPVSALMHAGIVNGGGILLVKYHHVISQENDVMYFIFVVGLITAVVGGFWKLIQVDIKKMLANSTMAQMGFMFMQCGLGLFPAAVAHLCWHGLFKAYLFLNSGSAIQGRYNYEKMDCDFKHYLGVTVSTLIAISLFIYITKINLSLLNTRWILLGFVTITMWQLSKSLVGKNHVILDLALVSLFSVVYGTSLRLIESCFIDGFSLPQLLKPFYVVGFLILMSLWFLINSKIFTRLKNSRLGLRVYMWGLNASQPYANTITAIRQTYQV